MSARKLQQEFDKTNKKIAEGLSVFDDIYDKLMTTEISSQKEKLESDLKKEIKKLQRSRDQLKQWLGDGSIKLDKNLLQENRTKIEHAMDQFKDLEKLLKIKQFSNEGLELQNQKKFHRFSDDPADAKKIEAYNYISDIIDQINQQNEGLEQEISQLSSQLRRSKLSSILQLSIEDCKYKQERNGNHLTQLEKILRNFENGKLDPERIEDIKDDLEYYVENNQDEDYVEYDDFYDQLEMDDENGEFEEGHGVLMGDLDRTKPESDEDQKSTSYPTVPSPSNENTPSQPQQQQQPQPQPQPQAQAQAQPQAQPQPQAQQPQSQSHTPIISKKKAGVVPATNPPPITNANSYSNVVKAATTNGNTLPSVAASATAAATATTAPASRNVSGKVPPPGLNNKLTTASPQAASSKLNSQSPITSNGGESEKKLSTKSQSESPIMLNENKTFWDTIPRLSTIPQLRLNNPLPFQNISSMLENSLLNCPDSFDAEKPRQYNPTNVHPSSVDYPQEPMYELNLSHIMKKFDNDTLFYCFYYSEGIYNLSKWNAAKELSKRGWIWNTETKQWFAKDQKNSKSRSMSVIQKEDTPDDNLHSDHHTEDEQDELKEQNYKYFDYERTWLIRRKDNFVFVPETRQTF